MPNFAVLIAAAGRSSRFNDPSYKKPFIKLHQKPVWLHSVERFQKRSDVKQVIIVISPEDQEEFMMKFGPNVAVLGLDVALGGDQRSDSVRNGMQKLDDGIEYVAVHDAARPCVSEDDIQAVFQAAEKSGAAILATPVTSTLKRVGTDHQIEETVDRKRLWQGQTPQVFRKDILLNAFQEIGDQQPTDEAQLIEMTGGKVSVVPGSPLNIKITTRADLRLAGACLDAAPKPKFDAPIHPFADDNLFR
uniref:2-C-methyl-D-erythritol 4-phosphate cytidylyltransferase n=1 Tax=uncultured planctomycete 5H12 TaxID=455067 RepID=A9LGP4_9BACT|nr:4-diphosphocytidyl-2C-methyl-D-erythritol synthase [uncultured planctomycete 5H12]